MSHLGNPIEVIKKLYNDKKWSEIVSFCKNMLEEDPKDLVALQNMATACLHLGKYEDALYCCEAVLEHNDSDEYALKNKIFALERLKRYQDVIACADKLLQKNPNDEWAHDSKGLSLNELGRHDDAIACYDKSLQLNPNNTTALMNKAITLAFLQKYEDAISMYDHVQKIDNTIKEAALAKSDAYHRLGSEDEAFLAAQGLLVEDIQKYVTEARTKKMKVFDLYCLNEYLELEAKEKKHQEKQGTKPNFTG
ncbi:MAG: tetratricopeptide repeat protein [Thermoproteota archaeon]